VTVVALASISVLTTPVEFVVLPTVGTVVPEYVVVSLCRPVFDEYDNVQPIVVSVEAAANELARYGFDTSE